jgi:hypothetical protein
LFRRFARRQVYVVSGIVWRRRFRGFPGLALGRQAGISFRRLAGLALRGRLGLIPRGFWNMGVKPYSRLCGK